MQKVLVTGGSGFVACYCIIDLLKAGYEVRATVRNLKRESDVRAMLNVGGIDAGSRLTFIEADLGNDKNWLEAAQDCEYVLHVASPFPGAAPKHEDELIIPAREGALRVLRAARDAGVKRVVMTSSFAAVGYGYAPQAKAFDETSWTNLAVKTLPAYHKSKTIAERAAWDFIAKEGGALELSVINPVGILGPALGEDMSASIQMVKSMMDGLMPAAPDVHFGVVDVRDVADIHIRAMTNPMAKGERFLAVAGDAVSLLQASKVLRKNLGAAASKTPTKQVPNLLLKVMSFWNAQAREVAPDLGNVRNSSNSKARRVLAWEPRSNEEAITAAGESLVRLGLLKSP